MSTVKAGSMIPAKASLPYRIARRKPRTAKVGIFGVGFHKYWPQFEGLLETLNRKLDVFTAKIASQGVDVSSFGIVDDAESAYALLPRLKAADLDLIFCDMLTYATSATFACIVREMDVPIVLVALQPLKTLDCANGSTFTQLCNDDFCAVPSSQVWQSEWAKKLLQWCWARSTTTQ